MKSKLLDIDKACALVQAGEVIAYPTEAVYGFGCDPFNKEAVDKLIRIKKRSVFKGFIILISSYEQLFQLIKPLNEDLLQKVKLSWPGHITWVFPKGNGVPDWLSPDGKTIAIRMSGHPVCRKLCINSPLISTSANISKKTAITNFQDLLVPELIDVAAVVQGDLGKESKPSIICDVITNKILR